MDIKFENKYIRDRAVVKEFFRYYSFKRKGAFINTAVAPILFFISLCAIIFIRDPIEEKSTYFITLVLALLVMFLTVFIYCKNVKIFLKREAEINNGEISEIITKITNESVTQITSKSETEVAFSNIKNLILTKNLIILVTKTNLNFIFKRDSFTIGSETSFLSFIKDKGFKVR